MRLFTGLDLTPEVLENLEQLLDFLRPSARIHWSPPANLHITTKFIGAWPEERLAELNAALASLPSRPAISVHLSNLGFFPNPRSPRVLWCGIDAPGLDALAADTDAATSMLGTPAETRAFSPHLTLARITVRQKKHGRQSRDLPSLDLQPLRDRIAALPSLEFGRFEAHRFFLYQSTLRPTGSVYTKRAEFPLSK